MADFNLYIPLLKRLEGGWSDNPNDSGGATMCGVTLAAYRQICGASKTKYDLRHISDYDWHTVMQTYWDKCKADKIANQSLAEIIVDWYINAGVNAIKNIQRALKLQPDGIIGPKSLAAINADAQVTFGKVKAARLSYYLKIGKGKNAIFLRGWINRTNQFTYKP